jgi:hypothetical protein
MSQSELSSGGPRGRLRYTAILGVSAVLIAAVALHLFAGAAERRARAPGSLAERTASAQLAARLEPFNPAFVHRAQVMVLWEQGQRHLAAGDYNRAVELLGEAYKADVGNSELLDLFKRAQITQALATNRKAHLQHAHEGPGGTLRPQDVER